MAETIVAKRELGEGKWDKVLKRRMVELSVADNYNDAKEEWIATGQVWWGNYATDTPPDWVTNSQMGRGKCLCGHSVVYHFEIVNTENGVVECVGSDHINTYLIMRALSEDLEIPIDTITDAQIQEWINVRVKSMKSQAWWTTNGAQFEAMFNAVKEMDLHYNTRIGDSFYNPETDRYESKRVLIKKGSGDFGSTYYKMASIVWRWNHPDNPKAQINTRGYPNDKLMQDLALFYVKSKALEPRFAEYKANREARKQEVAERKERQRREREERRIAAEMAEAERLRIYNLPENVEARRLEAEKREREKEEARERQKRLLAAREAKRLEDLAKAREEADRILKEESLEFTFACSNYGIEPFTAEIAINEWETQFLVDIKKRMIEKKSLTDRQLQKLRDIVTRELPTQKQIDYLRSLGYNGTPSSKQKASQIIDKLKVSETNDGYKGILKQERDRLLREGE